MKTTNNIEAKASKIEKTSKVDNNEKATKKSKKKDKKLKAKSSEPKEKTLVEEVKEQQTVSIIEEVISKRQVKYVYPEDVTDTLARKNWRQKTRNELHRLELQVARIKDTQSKEYKKALAEYEAFKNTVLKPQQIA